MRGDDDVEREHVPKSIPDRQISPECMKLALRLATVIESMRAEARFNVETFVIAAESELGGHITMAAPRKSGGRRRSPEARYKGEAELKRGHDERPLRG